jgi:hypothetical protein
MNHNKLERNRGSSVNVVITVRVDHRASILGRDRDFISSPPRPDRLWGPPSLISYGYEGAFSSGTMQPEREADHLPPSSAEVKNGRSYTFTPSYIMAWCLVKPRDNFNRT